MRAHEVIREARKRAGISQEEVASRIGLTFMEYSDVEDHADEFIMVLAVSEARRLCSELGLRLVDVVALEPLEANLSSELPQDLSTLPKHVLVRTQRRSLGMSLEEVAFAIGFDVAAVELAENDEHYLDTLPIAVVAELSKKLCLPLSKLLEPA
jgi:transcriptional regulator with XRE-family HTH domain